MFDLRVARKTSGPWTALRVAGAANVRECGEEVCSRESCKNGGTCIEVGATYRCVHVPCPRAYVGLCLIEGLLQGVLGWCFNIVLNILIGVL